ncbi:MAG TPA: CAP domain-containing protein [Solirubrobacteraceae bacterium]|nr:CAP domain-containing protein [Solirubrobacteraceae bacterium]
MAAAVLACASTLAAVMLTCAGALAAPTVRPADGPRGADGARVAAAGSPCTGESLHPTAANVSAIDAATLCLINRLRHVHGQRALRANRELRGVAASQVVAMVRRDYFADVRPTGQTPLSLVAITRYPVHAAEFAVGQNIAWGTGSDTTPAHIVQEWMASPPHREIMLSGEYRDVGVAVTPAVPAILGAGGHGATYAIEFGVRHF